MPNETPLQTSPGRAPAKKSKLVNALIYWAVFLCGLMPLGMYFFRIYTGRFKLLVQTESIVRYFGYFSLVMLLASLACTPIRTITRWNWPARVRKTLGLFGFLYAAMHLYLYVFYEKLFDLKHLFVVEPETEIYPELNLYKTIFGEAWKFPFQFFGMAAFILLIPLALTSTNWAIRKMGGKKWQRLHYLVYPIAILAAIHYYLAIKGKDKTQAWIFAGVLAVLLGVRVWKWIGRKKALAK